MRESLTSVRDIEKIERKLMLKKMDPKDFVILRDRWYSDKMDFGVKLTNRTGTIKIGNQEEINVEMIREFFALVLVNKLIHD